MPHPSPARLILPALLLALLLSAGACQPDLPDEGVLPGVEPTAPANDQQPANAADPRSIETLAGGWRVAGIDGEQFDEAYGLGLYATDSLIYWEPTCAGQERLYTLDGTGFSASIPPSEGPAITCDIALPERLDDLWAAMDMATTAERLPDNSVRLSGGGRSVTLFSQ